MTIREDTSENTPATSEPIEVLKERFELHRLLGRGAQGQTFLGLDRQSGQKVAVKELTLRDVADWKSIELFEREGATLKHLDHPGIPAYVEALHIGEGGADERFFLVQEYVEGVDFASLIADGKSFSEAEAKAILEELLQVLIYLQERSPAVIHRDIKPSNIMRRSDGRLALIDFGAVQSLAPRQQGGSTVVGTSGYMPVEQLMGRAQPATDLYALGATLVHLLSRQHPVELPMVQMRLQFEPYVNVSASFAAYLGRLLEPHVEARFSTAREALHALRHVGKDQRAPAQLAAAALRASAADSAKKKTLVILSMAIVGGLVIISMMGAMFFMLSAPLQSHQPLEEIVLPERAQPASGGHETLRIEEPAPPVEEPESAPAEEALMTAPDVAEVRGRLDALDFSECKGWGKATYELRITPDGELKILAVGPISTRGAVLGCVRSEIDAMRFPKSREGLELSYEFVVPESK